MRKEWWKTKGFVEIDILFASVLLGFMLVALSGAYIYAQQSEILSAERAIATNLANEQLEAARSIRDGAWNELIYAQSAIETSSGEWAFSGEGTDETLGDYTRTLTFADVCRDVSGVVTTCPGNSTDASSKFVTAEIDWTTFLGVTQTIEIDTLLTNWAGTDWEQTDWSAGDGQAIWLATNEYESDDGNVNIATTGEVTLVQTDACAEQVWDFDTAGDYTYASADIEVTGSFAQLKEQTDWWDEDYGYRLPLTITTGANAPDGTYDGYTVQWASFDTSTLVTGAKMQADCDDLRIVYEGGGSYEELDRVVLDCDTAATEIHFALTEDISDSTSDTDYYAYYGYSASASPPEDASNVYLWFDDASTDLTASYTTGRGDAWHGTGGTDTLTHNASGYYEYDTGDNVTNSFRIPSTTLDERDAYIEAEFYHTAAYPNDMTSGLVGRYQASGGYGTASESADHYYASNRGDSPFQVSSYTHDRSIMKTSRGTNAIPGLVGGPITGSQWRKQALAIWGINDTNGSFWDDDTAANLTPQGFPTAAGTTTGTDPSDYEGSGEWGLIVAQDAARLRNLLVRRYTSPEPSVTTGTEEAYGTGSFSGLASAVTSTLEYDSGNGEFPSILEVSTGIFATAYDGPGGDGWIETVSISNDGTTIASIDSLEFNTSTGTTPDLIHISGDYYAIAYRGPGNDGWLATVEIDSSGNITNSVVDTYEFDTSSALFPDIEFISGSIYAIAYEGPGSDGFVKTLSISPLGVITPVTLDTLEFDTSNGDAPDLFQVSGTMWAAAYEGPGSDGFVKTFTIDALGNIGTVTDTLEFDTSNGENISVLAVDTDTFAFVYDGPGTDGWLATIDIDSAGTISPVTSTLEFDTSNGEAPEIISVGGNQYIIAYEGGGNDGFISLLEIDSAGTISSVTDTLEFNSSHGQWVEVILVDTDTLAVFYESSDSDGFVSTIELESTATYPSDDPTIEPTTSYTGTNFDQWTYFEETATKNGGEIYYQLSDDDGSTWYYHDGSSWVTAGSTNYNTANEVHEDIHAFSATSGTIMFKAFLSGDGSQQVQLDSVTVGCGAEQYEVGSTTANGTWATVTLQNTYSRPVVVASVVESANTIPQTVRVRNADDNQFDIRLEQPSSTALSSETVYYLVMEEGVWSSGSVEFEARREEVSTLAYSSNWTGDAKTYRHTYSTAPIVLHQVMSDNDTSWISSFVSADGDRQNPPSTTGFQLAMNGADVTTSHSAETIGWIAWEQAQATIGGEVTESVQTGDSITGHDNGCTAVAHPASYFNATPIVLVSQQQQDAQDGGWAVICDNTASAAGFHVEEDQVGSSERNHSTEVFGYLAVNAAFNYSASGGGGGYASTGQLTSSAFDTGAASQIQTVEWVEDLSSCTSCSIEVEVRAAPDASGSPGTWSSWYGTSGSGSTFTDGDGELISTDLNGNQWVQYRVNLAGDGATTPTLESVKINYK